jgi:hypothetical protein
MSSRLLAFAGSLVVAGVVLAGQSKYAVPRLADGHPDLQGTYDLATLTPVERSNGMAAVLTDEETAKLERQAAARKEFSARAIQGDRDAPPKGGDGSPGPYGNVGGYNSFWIDSGSAYTIVDGQRRSSLVIDPPDGKVPPLTADARERNEARVVRTTSDETARENDPGFEGPNAYN